MAGWHVSQDSDDIEISSPTGDCQDATQGGDPELFFATRRSGNGGHACGDVGSNDIFGCGNVGWTPDAPSCAPLDRSSADLCSSLPTAWSCGTDDMDEANQVIKTDATAGGVLCCRD
jgi:hypothetical protein